VSVRRSRIFAFALVLALLALWTPAALAAPIDPPSVYGVPEPDPACTIDCDPPTDTTSVPAVPASGWFTGSVAVTLNATDAGSTVSEMHSALDSDPVVVGAVGDVVNVTGNGDHSFSHRAVDSAGNKSGWVLEAIAIDGLAPVNTTAAISSAVRAPAVITVTGTDAHSGVASVKWILDGGAVQSGPSGSTVSVATSGTHTLETWIVDVAGNESTPRVDTLNIDATKPVDASVVSSAWRTTAPAAITLSGTDGGAGMARMEYRIDGGAITPVANGGTVSFSIDGTYTLEHRAVDGVGNASDWVSSTVRLDTTKPANTSAASALWRDPDQHVTVSGTDATSGVKLVRWQVDGGEIFTGATGADLVVTGEGTHEVKTQIEDNAGNVSIWRTDTVKIDTALPVDTTAPPAGWQTSTVAITVQGSDAGSGVAFVEWSLDGPTVHTVAASSIVVNVSGDGQHTLKTRVTDALGHQTGWKSHAVLVDMTAPTNATEVLPSVWHSGRVPLELKATDGVSGMFAMQWELDGAPAATEPVGTVVAVTGDGTHTLRTRAVDVARNASGWATQTIKIDSVKPTDTTTVPAAVAYGTKITISGSDSLAGIDSVEWELDGVAGNGPGGSQVGLGGTGPHTLRHRVIDRAGNASDWKTDSVTVDPTLNGDSTPPVDTTTTGTAWRTASPATVTVTATDASTAVDHVEWRLDGGSPQSGPSGSTFQLTGEGRHRFETRAIDIMGNASSWTDREVKIDTVRPADTTAAPAWQRTTTLTLSGTDSTSGVAAMEWWIDGGSKQTGANGSAVTLPDGSHTIEHRVVDQAGNVSPRTSHVVQVDTVDPVDTTPTAPVGWSTSAWTVTPAGTDAGGSGVDTVEARVDDVPVTDFPIVIDQDGEHTLATRVKDVAGRITAWRSQTVQIDAHAPTDTTPAVPDGWRNTPLEISPAADDGAGSGVSTVEWKLGDAGAISTDPDVTVGAEGETVLMTRATDVAGHTSDWRSQTIKIDRVDPTVALDCGNGAWSPVSVVCAVDGAGGPSGLASLRFTRSGSAAQTVTAGTEVSVAVDGTWSVTLVATDGAGNDAQVQRTIKVDRTPPIARLQCANASAPTGYSCTASATDATSGAATLRRRVGGGAWQAIASGASFPVASGRVEVEAVDGAGLRGLAPAVTLAVRVPPPVVEPASPPVVRTRSVPVKRKGTKGNAGLLGAFELRSIRADDTANGSADVRPLSLGKGRFRVRISLVSGELTAQRERIMSFRRGGYSPRIGVALSGVTKSMRAKLTVERRVGKRWKRVSAVTATLKP
jgi:hypothetical protein